MFTANYHTHTKRCGHATGEDEEYVWEAIGHGIRKLGFSDHIMLPNFTEPYKRGDFSLFQNYIDSINNLKEKYKDQIKIYLGFEAEAFPCYFPFYKEILESHLIEYLILGNHASMNDKRELMTNFSKITNASQLYEYKDLAIKAMSSGMFACFAHPDYFLSSIDNFDSDCKKVSIEMIKCAIAYDIPLEINLSGIRNGKKGRDHWVYPREEFFKLVSKYKAKCIFGMDAHSPRQLNDEQSEYQALKFAKDNSLIIIDELESL